MIRFEWNGVTLHITDIGGGTLNERIPRHAHAKDCYEIHFILGGEGELITDSEAFALCGGDFFITGPNVYHEQNTNANDPVQDVFLMLHVVEKSKANSIASCFFEREFCFLNEVDSSDAEVILKEYREKKVGFESVISGLSMKILTDITRRWLPENINYCTADENLADRRFVLIEQAFLYENDLTLARLSDKIGLCERQTQRLLQKYYGKNFREKKKEGKVKI